MFNIIFILIREAINHLIFITINQTRDEMKEEVMRLYTDKLRDYKNGDPIHIANNFSCARFYDRKRTLEMDWEDEESND